MDQIKITSGAMEIIATGLVIQFREEHIVFELRDVKFIMIFANDPDKTEPRLEANVVENKIVELKLFNFNNPIGTGNIEPMPLGTFGDKQFYLQYRVYSMEKGSKTIHYTFYLEV